MTFRARPLAFAALLLMTAISIAKTPDTSSRDEPPGAIVTQFIDPARGASTIQILALGGVFLAIALTSDMVYAFASGSIGSWLSTRERVARQRDTFTGVVYILLGAFAAVTGSSSARHG